MSGKTANNEITRFRAAAGAAEAMARAAGASIGAEAIRHAEAACARTELPWERAIIWTATALGAETINEPMLSMIGLPLETIAQAEMTAERQGERITEYAVRTGASNVPEVISAAIAKVGDETRSTWTDGKPCTGDRIVAAKILDQALYAWRAAAGGGVPTGAGTNGSGPGLEAVRTSEGLYRLETYVVRSGQSLEELRGKTPMAQRLTGDELERFEKIGVYLLSLAVGVGLDLASIAGHPPSTGQRAMIGAAATSSDGSAIGQMALTATRLGIVLRHAEGQDEVPEK